MTISLRRKPNDRLLELGGGARPLVHPECRGGRDVALDVRACNGPDGRPCVDIVADLNGPLPLTSDEFDGVFSQFCLEHISWRNLPALLKEIHRVLKPGGMAVAVVPNTEAQIKYILAHPQGWDGRDMFQSASCILFGDQDYKENSHSGYFSPSVAEKLFIEAGFTDIKTVPYGAIETDMCITAMKPAARDKGTPIALMESQKYVDPDTRKETEKEMTQALEEAIPYEPERWFNKAYWDNYRSKGSFVWDYPTNEGVARNILARQPSSVLELGPGRGYVLKRLQDAGIRACGLEVSRHCWLTRVADGIIDWDITKKPWPFKDKEFDLCFSLDVLQHIPERLLPNVLEEMHRVCSRGTHAIDFNARVEDDKTRVTNHPKSWWALYGRNVRVSFGELLNKPEVEQFDLPKEFWEGDGSIKLNIGCAMTMFHNGWENIDVFDHLQPFAQQYRYKYKKLDVRQGLPYNTESVSLIFMSHCLEHFTYEEGKKLLADCRRVLKPNGLVRIVVPDAGLLTACYASDAEIGDWGGSTFRGSLHDFDEINEGCANAPTLAGKLWAMLHEGHSSCYDQNTLIWTLEQAGFASRASCFRDTADGSAAASQMRKEALDTLPCLSLFVDGAPRTK